MSEAQPKRVTPDERGSSRVPFTVQLPIDVAEQLHESAQLYRLTDEDLGAEALARGLASNRLRRGKGGIRTLEGALHPLPA